MDVLNGENLVKTLVNLSELPEPLAQREVSQVLELSGHQPESLTLEDLRAAMLVYLEEMQASMEAEFAACGDESAEDSVGAPLASAGLSKTPVFFD